MWYAGIDWADRHHDAVVVDDAGKRVASIRGEHSPEGLERLVGSLEGIGDVAERPDNLACILEVNRGLLIAALLEAGLPVYPVNPKTVDRHRKPSGARTDAIDAYLLARTGHSDLADLRRLAPDGPVIEELKTLTRDREGLIRGQTRLVNQLTARLKAYYPAALGLFAQLHQRTALAFLRAFPTAEGAEAAQVGAIAEVLRAARHPYPDTRAKRIAVKLQEPQLTADPVTARARSRLMLALATQLLPLIEADAGYDREIERLFASHPDGAIFTSLPGSGEKLAPRLLAEWGDDRGRYEDASSVQALAGSVSKRPVLPGAQAQRL
jgi:transposase